MLIRRKKKQPILFLIAVGICTIIAFFLCIVNLENITATDEVQEVVVQEQADNENTAAEEATEDDSRSNTGVQGETQDIMENVAPESYIIESFPIINQMPELPTGCEITALTMAMNYYGINVDKVTMATEYLPTDSANLYYGDDGRLYGSDMYSYFIGDPTSALGYICGPGAIVDAADKYFSEFNIQMQAVDISGTVPEDLYNLVTQDIPVVVWVTIGMADRATTEGWYTEDGAYVDWSTNDHGAVLIGYTDDTVTLADPISGLSEYNRIQFEKVFVSRKCQCVILETN